MGRLGQIRVVLFIALQMLLSSLFATMSHPNANKITECSVAKQGSTTLDPKLSTW